MRTGKTEIWATAYLLQNVCPPQDGHAAVLQVRETHNPIWNDQIVFAIPPNNVRLHDVQFDVTVLHVDMVKGAHAIGRVRFVFISKSHFPNKCNNKKCHQIVAERI